MENSLDWNKMRNLLPQARIVWLQGLPYFALAVYDENIWTVVKTWCQHPQPGEPLPINDAITAQLVYLRQFAAEGRTHARHAAAADRAWSAPETIRELASMAKEIEREVLRGVKGGK